VCEIAYCPPLEWESMLAFLRDRVCAGVEAVDGDRYYRTVSIGEARGWLSIAHAPGKDALRVEVSLSLATKLRPVMAMVKRAFDLEAQPSQIADQLGEIAVERPGLRIPGSFDGFETAVRAILGQQVSVAAATTLAGRYVRAFGEPIEAPIPGLTHLTPAAAHIAAIDPDELVKLGILRSRALTIVGLAQAVAEKRISLHSGVDVQRTMELLKELPGIGEWTAQYISMRSLRWPDAFPHTDLGIRKALQTTNSKQILEIAEAWRPWRAYAVMHLWKSLETTP
jgi:AraC family transcriptional regulator of adaptative response / DNA-3-methyladenine glycosylase II